MKIKKIAVLTSGGDAPGMNSAIFGVFTACRENNIKLLGVIGGYDGLIDNNIIELNFDNLNGKINAGGSLIKSSRSPRFLKQNYFKKAVNNIKDNKIDALIVIGGDGSIRGAMALRDAGIKIITLPGTIDNDLAYTDYTIGFDTAVTTVLEAISKIRDTSSSHERTTVIEVMGRHCGDIALYAGLAGGAEAVLVPEIETNLNEVCQRIVMGANRGK